MADDTSVGMLLEAAHFAASKHVGQRRKNSDIPYINHPLAVAHSLWEEGGVRDAATLAAAILHDTVEDTDTTTAELEREFGPEIAGIVGEVTDDKQLAKAKRKRRQIEHAPELSVEARTVKLGDKLCNLRDLLTRPPASWDRERVQGYFCWAYHVVQGLGSANEALRKRLEELFSGTFTWKGKSVPVLPQDARQREALLEDYFEQMAQLAD